MFTIKLSKPFQNNRLMVYYQTKKNNLIQDVIGPFTPIVSQPCNVFQYFCSFSVAWLTCLFMSSKNMLGSFWNQLVFPWSVQTTTPPIVKKERKKKPKHDPHTPIHHVATIEEGTCWTCSAFIEHNGIWRRYISLKRSQDEVPLSRTQLSFRSYILNTNADSIDNTNYSPYHYDTRYPSQKSINWQD